MKRLYAPYLQQLWGVNGNAPILPEHLLAKYNDDKGSINTAPYNSLPIGSGPFKVVEWQRGTVMRMDANPNYFLGAPKLDEVELKTLPDENTLETQVQTHEIDMLAHGTGINWLRYKALGDDPKNGLKAIRVDRSSSRTSTSTCSIRSSATSTCAARWRTRPNRQEIIDKIMHGSGEAAETDQSPTLSWAYTKDIAALSLRSGQSARAARRRRLEGRARTASASRTGSGSNSTTARKPRAPTAKRFKR